MGAISFYSKDNVDSLLTQKQNVLTAGSGITIANDVISATGGGMTTVNETVLTTQTDTITLPEITEGLYVVNIPTFGGTYLVQLNTDDVLPDFSTQQIANVTPYGGTNGDYLLRIKASVNIDELNLILEGKSISNLSGSWTNITMPSGTYWYIYRVEIAQ